MKLIKNEKGITLVALIITIIVLLILAIVSIRAIKDGGILSKTQTAKEVYSESEEKEKIQLAINQAAIDGLGTINKEPLNTALKEQFGEGNFEITEETEYFKVKIKSSGRIYTINKNGSIESVKQGWTDNGNGSYTKGNETVKIGDKKTSEDVKKALGIEDIKYKGKWQVIGVEEDKIKLVSEGSVKLYNKLGYDDPIVYKKDVDGTVINEVIDEITDTNGDGTIGDLEKAAYSYAHAVETLNKVASNATGIEGARSVTIEDIYGIIGENSVYKGSYYGRRNKYYCDDTTNGEVYYKYKNSDGTWSAGRKFDYQPFTYTNEKKETITIGKLADGRINQGSIELTDTYFTYNLNNLSGDQTKVLGSLMNGSYWLASTCIGLESSWGRSYCVRYMDNGNIMPNCLFYSIGIGEHEDEKVRAVVYI